MIQLSGVVIKETGVIMDGKIYGESIHILMVILVVVIRLNGIHRLIKIEAMSQQVFFM